jgi:hypothetical protein
MGFMSGRWEETDRLLRERLQPLLAPGEPLVGVVHANRPKTFSAQQLAVGVTPHAMILAPVDRRMRDDGGAVHRVTREEITSSSIWGWGGSAADFLSMTSDQQIRFTSPATGKVKLLVLGGNVFEDALSGEGQKAGLTALIDFLRSAQR